MASKLRGRLLGLAFAAVAGALPLTVQAQQMGAVSGTVLDDETAEPVEDAMVFVEGAARHALSDAAGRFRLSGLAPGEHRVSVERIGFATGREVVAVTAGETAEIVFRLSGQAISIPAVVVTATREARRLDEVAASVGVIGRGDLDEARPSHPSEVMGSVSGVWVNVTGGEGHMTAIRQPLTTDPVYLYLEDGVPTRSTGFFNHNALYEINLPQAERVEVMKGPSNALYGSDAIGGVVNVQTRAPTRDPSYEVSLEAGEHGYARLLASASGQVGEAGLRSDLNYTRTDGWRDGTSYDRWSGTLRWDQGLRDDVSLKAIAAWSRIDQSTAGSSRLSLGDFEGNPTSNYTPISWREVDAFRLSAEVEKRLAHGSLVVTPYVRSNRMDILPNWSLTYDPAVWKTDNLSFGALAKLRWDLPSDGQLIGGVDVDYSPGGHAEWAVLPTRDGPVFTSYTLGDPLYDYDVSFRQASPYLHLELAPLDRLRFSVGARLDLIGYDYENHLGVAQTGRHRRPADASPTFGAFSPKLGVTYRVNGRTSLYGAVRDGFRAPSEGQLFRQGSALSTVDLEPVRARSVELGVRGALGRRISYELSGYRMRMTDEILGFVLADGATENVNAGGTMHRGVEASLGVALPEGLRVDAAWTLAEHLYESWSPAEGIDFSGNQMLDAPGSIGRVGLAWSPPGLEGASLGLTWDHLGPYWIDQTNENEYDGHDLIGARAAYRHASGLGLFLRAHNLADARYAESAGYNAFRGAEYAPGLPRTFYLGLEVR